MAEEFDAATQEQKSESKPLEKIQIANMDYSDYLTLLMESRIIQPNA